MKPQGSFLCSAADKSLTLQSITTQNCTATYQMVHVLLANSSSGNPEIPYLQGKCVHDPTTFTSSEPMI